MIILVAALAAGLVFGSFLNVCIVRLPPHLSIVAPRSHCTSCDAPIRPTDNIPVLSWVLLRGRCRACDAPIAMQYPLVELALAVLFAACVLNTGTTWQTLLSAAACFFLLGLAIMDAQTMLLPDAFTIPGLAVAFLLRVAAPDAHHRGAIALHTLQDAAVASAMLLLVSYLYRAIRKQEGIGLGDVKLLGMMAAFLGLPQTLVAFFLAVVSAAAYALVLVVRHRATSKTRIAFGSFLAIAGIGAIFFGRPLLTWYLGLF
ncbi:MAG TPA: prepilin peptidase [Acidobacteriaceae bacterium]|nr:prepilin peptidase [Acidobacteriaceae bacterium]